MVQIAAPEYVVASDLTLKCFGRPTIGSALPPRHRVQKLRGTSRYFTPSSGGSNQFPTWAPGAVIPLGNGEAVPADAATGVWSPLNLSGPAVGIQVGARPDIHALTRFDGQITLADGHATYQNLDVYGRLTGRCSTWQTDSTHVCVRNCIIRGNAGQLSEPITGSNLPNDFCAGGTNLDFGAAVFEWVSFDATGRTYITKDGIDGGGYEARYCEFRQGVDGVGVNKTGNVKLLNCRSWDGMYYGYRNSTTGANYVTPGQSTGNSHNDGCQWQVGRNGLILGSFFGGTPYLNNSATQQANLDPAVPDQYAVIQQIRQGTDYNNSAMILQNSIPANGNVQVTVQKGWLAGGATRLNLGSRGNTDKMAEVIVTDMKFFRTVLASPRIVSPGYEIYAINDHQATLARNTYAHNGAAVTVTTYA